MGTLRPHDLHQMAPIFLSSGRDVELSGAPDLHRMRDRDLPGDRHRMVDRV